MSKEVRKACLRGKTMVRKAKQNAKGATEKLGPGSQHSAVVGPKLQCEVRLSEGKHGEVGG